VASKKNGSHGYVTEPETIKNFLSQKYRVPTIDLARYEIELDVIRLVPKEVCVQYVAIPVSRIAHSLVVALADPTNQPTLDALKSLTGLSIEPVIASSDEISQAIAKYYA